MSLTKTLKKIFGGKPQNELVQKDDSSETRSTATFHHKKEKKKRKKDSGEIIYSIYRFEASSPDEITISEIDHPYLKLSKPKQGWLHVYDYDNLQLNGYAPYEYFAPKDSLLRLSYYHGEMTRKESQEVARSKGTGSVMFLVRKSSHKKLFALDVYDQTGMPKNYIIDIRKNEDGDNVFIYQLNSKNYFFDNIESIINLIYGQDMKSVPIERQPPSLPGIGMCLNNYQIKASDIHWGNCIGAGEFGKVYVGKLKGKKVAIKKLKSMDSIQHENEFKSEFALMMGVHHPNITDLIGVVFDDKNLCIITPFAENGCLRDILIKRYAEDPIHYFLHSELVKMVHDVSKGMEYLHFLKIIHNDLAGRNILVDYKRTCKVSDFGLSKRITSPDGIVIHGKDEKIPLRQMPPEFFRDRKLSRKVDVWQFGILIIEVYLNGQQPYSHMPQNALIVSSIRNGVLHPKPDRMKANLYNKVCEMCFCMDPEDRWDFEHIVPELLEIRHIYEEDNI